MDKKWEDFEIIGEKEISQKLASGEYGSSDIISAKAWLNHKSSERSDSFKTEGLDLDRKATAAAESASSEARSARIALEKISSEMRSARFEARIAIIIAAIVAMIEIIDKWEKIKDIFSP